MSVFLVGDRICAVVEFAGNCCVTCGIASIVEDKRRCLKLSLSSCEDDMIVFTLMAVVLGLQIIVPKCAQV